MKNQTELAYIRDTILILKRTVKMMPDELPKENQDIMDFEMMVLLAEKKVSQLKKELDLV